MNEFLSQIYETPDAREKTAQSVLLSKLAQDEGIDLSSLSEDQLEDIAQSVLNESESVEDDELAKEAQENFAQADFLGRVMAHSMTQELELIKQAGFGDFAGKMKGHAGKAFGKAKEVGKKAVSAAGRSAKGFGEHLKGGRTVGTSEGPKRVGNTSAGLFNKPLRKDFAKSQGARAAVGGGVGAVGYGAHKAMSKEASAFDTLATQRALEMLAEKGYDVESMMAQQEQQYAQPQLQQHNFQQPQVRAPQQLTAPQLQGQGYSQGGYGNVASQSYAQPSTGMNQAAQGYEKVADPMEQFWGSVDERAYQILGDAGYLDGDESAE